MMKKIKTTDGFSAGDCIVRQFPGKEPTHGTIVRVDEGNDEIVVEWDWGGFPQGLPPDQRTHVFRIGGR